MSNEEVLITSQLERASSTVGVFELPCGYLDDDNRLHTEVVVREITGEEEDIMASEHIADHMKLNELLSRCVTRIGIFEGKAVLSRIVKELTMGDRVFLMFAIRRTTVGNEYPFYEVCPNPKCKRKSLYRFDMGQMDIRKMPDPMKRVFDVVLPSGIKATYKVSTGLEEERIFKIRNSKKDAMDRVSIMVLLRISSLNGDPPTLESVKKLGMNDRNFIRELQEEVEGGVDTTLEMECPVCGHEFEVQLDPNRQGFFSPSAVLKRSKKKSSI
jgi:hypothetical protein